MPSGNGWDRGKADGMGCGFGYGDGGAANVTTWIAAGGNGDGYLYGRGAEFYWTRQEDTGSGYGREDGSGTGMGSGDPESTGETWTTTRRDQRRADFP